MTHESDQSKQIDEFIKKYKHTYLVLNGKDIVWFDGYDGDYFHLQNEAGVVLRIVYNSDAIIAPVFPQRSLISVEGKLAYFARIPARQYKKAPCRNNCLCYDPLMAMFAQYYRVPDYLSGINHRRVAAAIFPSYFEYTALVNQILKGKLEGGALSPEFGLTMHPLSDTDVLMFYQDIPVATCNTQRIQVLVPTLKQEISDFIKRFQLTVTLE